MVCDGGVYGRLLKWDCGRASLCVCVRDGWERRHWAGWWVCLVPLGGNLHKLRVLFDRIAALLERLTLGSTSLRLSALHCAIVLPCPHWLWLWARLCMHGGTTSSSSRACIEAELCLVVGWVTILPTTGLCATQATVTQ